jgi:hypothetical protein
MPVSKGQKPEKSYCLRRSGVDSHDGHCKESTHKYIQPEERNAVPLHAARAAEPIGSDGCVRVNIFTMRNTSGFCVSPNLVTTQQRYEEQQLERSVAALKRRATALDFVIAPAAAGI